MSNADEETLPDCPAEAELLRRVFQGKWRLVVLRELIQGPLRLSDLRKRIPECSKKMIIDTLHDLERLILVERQDLSTKQAMVFRCDSSLRTHSGHKLLKEAKRGDRQRAR